jgi:O-antigen ligase
VLLAGLVFIGAYQKGYITEFTVDRIKSIKNPEQTNLVDRFAIWRVGWRIVKDNFITGVGLGNFAQTFRRYIGSHGGVLSGFIKDPHNTYLSVLAETGIIGFMLFMWFHGNLILTILKKANKNQIFALCILAFIAIVSLKGTYLFKKVYWFSISLSYLIALYYSKNIQVRESRENEGN